MTLAFRGVPLLRRYVISKGRREPAIPARQRGGPREIIDYPADEISEDSAHFQGVNAQPTDQEPGLWSAAVVGRASSLR